MDQLVCQHVATTSLLKLAHFLVSRDASVLPIRF